jgi:ankyrin repeat protein
MAIGYKHKDVAELLILKGADVNAASKYGITPLTSATILKQKDVMELLISKGAHE